MKVSHLAAVLEGTFATAPDNGIGESRDILVRYLHESVHSATGISSAELLVLAFHVVQVFFYVRAVLC